jgi:hypothetical protein
MRDIGHWDKDREPLLSTRSNGPPSRAVPYDTIEQWSE